jgi:hypothetical protein
MNAKRVSHQSRQRRFPSRHGKHLVARKLGDGLGALRHGVLGELTGQHETDSRLDFAATERRLLVVGSKLSGFRSNTLKDIVNEGVHDRHSLLGNSGIGVHLLQHLVDVGAVGFDALLRLGLSRGLLGRLGGLLGGSLGHCEG